MADSILKRGLRKAVKAAVAAGDVPFRRREGPRILIYHQVGSALGRQMEVSKEAFAKQIEWIVSNGSIVSLEDAVQKAGEADSDRLFVLTFDDGYLDMYENAFPMLRSLGVPFTVYVTTGPVESGVGTIEGGGAEPPSWEQLEEMASHGATIGSHTHTHPDLRHETAERISRELAESDDLIEARLGIRSRHFCYPYGYWAPEADRLVRARYETATLGAGAPVTPDTDPYLIPRIPVQLSDGHFFFVRKMESGMIHEEWVRRKVSGYRGVAS